MMEIKAYASQVTGALINVTKIDGIDDDFIMGMDVSSYVSVTNSGVVFKDFDGKVLDYAVMEEVTVILIMQQLSVNLQLTPA